jgi:hypothetical protein
MAKKISRSTSRKAAGSTSTTSKKAVAPRRKAARAARIVDTAPATTDAQPESQPSTTESVTTPRSIIAPISSIAAPDDLPPMPRSRDALRHWLRTVLGISVPTRSLIDGHSTPLDYLAFSFLEDGMANGRGERDAHAAPADHPTHILTPGVDGGITLSVNPPHDNTDPYADTPTRDCVVWANRGGGKTFLGAVATLLDLLYKPGIEIRILGGSLEQSRRMHAHLRRLVGGNILAAETHDTEAPQDHDAPRCGTTAIAAMVSRLTESRLVLRNGSIVELLAQSHTSVRGTRVQKLRCDEVDLFKPEVWEAAQLTTRSATLGGIHVRGSVECLSTMHLPHGVMHTIVKEAREGSRRLFRWGVVDVLSHCGKEHTCLGAPSAEHPEGEPRCALWQECRGRAKRRTEAEAGHVTVADALAMKRRVPEPVWKAEMLCIRTRRSDSVLPEFDRARHIVTDATGPGFARTATIARERGVLDASLRRTPLRWVVGMDFGIRGDTAILWGAVDEHGTLWIVDERVVPDEPLVEHITHLGTGLAREGAPCVTPEHGWPAPEFIAIDPAGLARDQQTGLTNADLLRQAGLAVRAKRMKVHPGLIMVRARLAPANNDPPRLFIHERCTRLIESLERYRYPSENRETIEPVKGEGWDHAIDALRYLIQNLDKPMGPTRVWYAS